MFLTTLYLRVCFLTLLERKILGYAQNRKGPNKILIIGLIQPVVDGGKLLFKFIVADTKFIFISFWLLAITRLIGLIISINNFMFLGNFFIFIALMRILIVYLVFILGWERIRVYGVTGGLRRSSQIIAYDVVLLSLFIFIFILILRLSLKLVYRISFLSDLLLLWFIVVLIETNRSPYDSAEGERESVSGFNIEYLGVLFAFPLIAEYGMIVVFRWVRGLILFNVPTFIVILIIIIIIRGFIPRSRYDLIIIFCWKSIFTYSRLITIKIL